MLKLSLARLQREEKTAYLAVRIGDLAGFAALRYDLRHLLRAFLRAAGRRHGAAHPARKMRKRPKSGRFCFLRTGCI